MESSKVVAEGKGGEDESRRWERRIGGTWEGGRGDEGERGRLSI